MSQFKGGGNARRDRALYWERERAAAKIALADLRTAGAGVWTIFKAERRVAAANRRFAAANDELTRYTPYSREA